MKLINALFLFSLLLVSLASFFAMANSDVPSCRLPEKVTFSSIEHPKVQNVIQPLIEDVYNQLGIRAEFLIVSSYRDLMLVSNNKLVGSVVFAEDIIDTLPDLIKVQPPISKMSYVLLCKKGSTCRSEVVTDAENKAQIVTTNAMAKSLAGHYPELAKTRLLPTSEMKNIMSFIRKGRVEYGVYPISDRTRGGLNELPEDLDYAILYDINSYHVLNRAFACLVPSVEPILKAALSGQ